MVAIDTLIERHALRAQWFAALSEEELKDGADVSELGMRRIDYHIDASSDLEDVMPRVKAVVALPAAWAARRRELVVRINDDKTKKSALPMLSVQLELLDELTAELELALGVAP